MDWNATYVVLLALITSLSSGLVFIIVRDLLRTRVKRRVRKA